MCIYIDIHRYVHMHIIYIYIYTPYSLSILYNMSIPAQNDRTINLFMHPFTSQLHPCLGSIHQVVHPPFITFSVSCIGNTMMMLVARHRLSVDHNLIRSYQL